MTTPKAKFAGDRDSDCLLPHGFHPIFGLMLSGMLDQHDPARSDGRHRENFFRRLQKKRKPARQGNRCTSRVYSPTRKVRKTKSDFSRSVVSDHVCEKGRMSALGH